jgi:hypothetical protein
MTDFLTNLDRWIAGRPLLNEVPLPSTRGVANR